MQPDPDVLPALPVCEVCGEEVADVRRHGRARYERVWLCLACWGEAEALGGGEGGLVWRDGRGAGASVE